jgi:small GTP-binding protein
MATPIAVKLVIIGDSSVGKTCIALRYLTGEFTTQTRPTISAGFSSTTIKVNGIDLDLQLWDTAGQERYRGVTAQYFRGAQIALIVFDLSNRETLNSIREWNSQLRDGNSVPVVVVVGNKADIQQREVTEKQGEIIAAEINAIYRETSAVTGRGIAEVFEDACEQFLEIKPPQSEAGLYIDKKPKNTGGCC